MDHFAEYSGVVLMILVGAFGLFGHWLACMWFAIGINTICTDEGKLMEHNWLVRFSNDISRNIKNCGGGTGLLSCVQIAKYMGANKIVLLGADFGIFDKKKNNFNESSLKKKI